MIKEFISLLYPQNCMLCRQSLNSTEQQICTSCKIDLPLTDDFEHTTNELLNKFTFQANIHFAASLLYFQRDSVVQTILHLIKYKGKTQLAQSFGQQIGQQLSKGSNHFDLIIPVPLHSSKEKLRGYNQSEEIAKGIEKEAGILVRSGLVKRKVKTITQTKKSKVDRWNNIEGIYEVLDNSRIKESSILIVDDVITTGATTGYLADCISNAGAKSIGIVSLARAK